MIFNFRFADMGFARADRVLPVRLAACQMLSGIIGLYRVLARFVQWGKSKLAQLAYTGAYRGGCTAGLYCEYYFAKMFCRLHGAVGIGSFAKRECANAWFFHRAIL